MYNLNNIQVQGPACRLENPSVLVWHSEVYMWKKWCKCTTLSTEIYEKIFNMHGIWPDCLKQKTASKAPGHEQRLVKCVYKATVLKGFKCFCKLA
jgi:hypothetical protein